jgi:PAS domain S-box-containing protein
VQRVESEFDRLGPEEVVGAARGHGRDFDIGRDLLCTSDASGYFTSLNVGWEKLLGWSREELMARPFIEFVHPDDVERTAAESAKVTNPDEELVDFENRYMCRDGGWRWLHWSARSDGTTWFAVAFDVTERKETEERLRRVLTDEFLLAYSQPILDQLGVLVQEELLVRLRGPNGNGEVIGPQDFVPDAERTGLIGIVDRWMAKQGLALAERGRVAEVNLAGSSVGDAMLTQELAEEMEFAGEGAGRVIFEITETTAIENLDAAMAFTDRLAGLGCRFALDDFGTGFGSVTYLRHLPVDYLKIDTTFVRGARERPEDLAIIRAIVAMAREMGAQTVAEGIEDTETLQLLYDSGVDYCQGFLLGRPAPIAA